MKTLKEKPPPMADGKCDVIKQKAQGAKHGGQREEGRRQRKQGRGYAEP